MRQVAAHKENTRQILNNAGKRPMNAKKALITCLPFVVRQAHHERDRLTMKCLALRESRTFAQSPMLRDGISKLPHVLSCELVEQSKDSIRSSLSHNGIA